MRRKKGFTLIELIIVLAIIGILMGILIPSWGYYMRRARTKTQNNNAKIIFNAAQTVVTEIKFSERKYINDYNNAATEAEKDDALKHIYSHVPGESNEWYFYWNGITGVGGRVDSGSGDSVNADDWSTAISRAVMKILDTECVYKIYVKDYQVQSVASARFASDKYIGAYPINTDKLDDWGVVDVDTQVHDVGVENLDMLLFDIDTSDVDGT